MVAFLLAAILGLLLVAAPTRVRSEDTGAVMAQLHGNVRGLRDAYDAVFPTTAKADQARDAERFTAGLVDEAWLKANAALRVLKAKHKAPPKCVAPCEALLKADWRTK